MDFLDPKKRKAHIRRLYLGYVLMAIAIGLGAIILLFASSGYWVDRKGNVFQNGLVFLSSAPDGAQVKINNQENTYTNTVVTSDRLELKADSYHFQFLKQGYKPWEHSFAIRGGSIERIVYPFLVPENLTTTNIKTYTTNVGLVTQTPDRKTTLVQQSNSLTSFEVFDNDNPSQAPTSFNLPNNLLPESSAVKAYQLVEWSNDNRHVLLRYDGDSGPIFIVVDRNNPDQSLNLNSYFGISISKISFRDKDPQRYYVLLPDKRLISAEVNNKVQTNVAENVLDFKSHGNSDILFVTTSSNPDKSTVKVRSGTKTYSIREVKTSDNYILDLAQYGNQWYMVVGSSSDEEVYIYRDPVLALENVNNVSPTIRTVHLANSQRAMFSATTRFIAVQSDSNFVIYDAEKDQQYKFTVNPAFDDPSMVRWMDGHRLMGATAGKVLIIDFDGTNQQTLSPMVSNTIPMFNSNYQQLLTLAPAATGQALTNTPMRVP